MRRLLFWIATLLTSLPATALAGGDYVEGLLSQFSGSAGTYSFSFVQSGHETQLFHGCNEYQVVVTYARVPWYSWLPFIHASHPTRSQTEAAADVLRLAFTQSTPVSFGYMGNGLVPIAGAPCAFRSKALQIIEGGSMPIVVAYHDPV